MEKLKGCIGRFGKSLSVLFLAAQTIVEHLWELGVTPEENGENTAYELSLFHNYPEQNLLPAPLSLSDPSDMIPERLF